MLSDMPNNVKRLNLAAWLELIQSVDQDSGSAQREVPKRRNWPNFGDNWAGPPWEKLVEGDMGISPMA